MAIGSRSVFELIKIGRRDAWDAGDSQLKFVRGTVILNLYTTDKVTPRLEYNYI